MPWSTIIKKDLSSNTSEISEEEENTEIHKEEPFRILKKSNNYQKYVEKSSDDEIIQERVLDPKEAFKREAFKVMENNRKMSEIEDMQIRLKEAEFLRNKNNNNQKKIEVPAEKIVEKYKHDKMRREKETKDLEIKKAEIAEEELKKLMAADNPKKKYNKPNEKYNNNNKVYHNNQSNDQHKYYKNNYKNNGYNNKYYYYNEDTYEKPYYQNNYNNNNYYKNKNRNKNYKNNRNISHDESEIIKEDRSIPQPPSTIEAIPAKIPEISTMTEPPNPVVNPVPITNPEIDNNQYHKNYKNYKYKYNNNNKTNEENRTYSKQNKYGRVRGGKAHQMPRPSTESTIPPPYSNNIYPGK